MSGVLILLDFECRPAIVPNFLNSSEEEHFSRWLEVHPEIRRIIDVAEEVADELDWAA